MAFQTVKFEYDSFRNILFVEDDYEINAKSEVDAFLSLYEEKLNEIGHKVFIVASIDGLKIGAKAYVYYGKRIKELYEKWILGLARWGTDQLSRMTVRAASMTAKYDISLYNTKESAVAAIETMIDHLKKGSV